MAAVEHMMLAAEFPGHCPPLPPPWPNNSQVVPITSTWHTSGLSFHFPCHVLRKGPRYTTQLLWANDTCRLSETFAWLPLQPPCQLLLQAFNARISATPFNGFSSRCWKMRDRYEKTVNSFHLRHNPASLLIILRLDLHTNIILKKGVFFAFQSLVDSTTPFLQPSQMSLSGHQDE